MVAATALTQRRAESREVEDYLAARPYAERAGRPAAARSAAQVTVAPPLRSRHGSSGRFGPAAAPPAHWPHGHPCRIPYRVPDDPRAARLHRRALRRRHPPAGVDQRPRRRRRRADRRALQRPRHQPVGVAGAARPRLRRPGRQLEPPRHRRLGAAGRPAPRRHRRVRRGRAVGDGPLRRRQHRPHGLVDGRQHDVRAGHPPPGAGPGPVRRRRRPRRHLRHDARPVPPPARRRRRAHRQRAPGCCTTAAGR